MSVTSAHTPFSSYQGTAGARIDLFEGVLLRWEGASEIDSTRAGKRR